MKKIKYFLLAAVSVSLLGVLTACGGSENDNEIHIGYFNNVTHAQALVMKANGTLEEALGDGVSVEWTAFNAGPAEQEALSRADLIVWQHPMQWYSIPPLLKLWIDKVFSHGWAYGHGGTALHGKHLLWAVTTGGGESHFEIGAHPGFDVLSQPLQATAIYCGLNWLPPFAMHCTFICDDETLEGQARHYKQRLLEWQEAHHG